MNAYDWWLSALELAGDYGVLTREQLYDLGCHENEPQPGFWRVPPPKRGFRAGDDDEVYVRIWPEGAGLRAHWQGEPIDACAAWSWCCRYPISEERYERLMRNPHNRLGAFGTSSPHRGKREDALSSWSA